MIHVTATGKIATPYHEGVATLFPYAQRFSFQGRDMLALRHRTEETIMLRRFGIDAPAPVLTQYDWGSRVPFEVQRKTIAMLTTNNRAYCLNGLGSGKTFCALSAFNFLRQDRIVNKMLVVCPMSTMRSTWAKEIFEQFPNLTCSVLFGAKPKRLKLLAENADIYIINHDGFATIREEIAARADIDLLCIDELAIYRNGQATRTKVMKQYAATKDWVWGMTGSPVPNGPQAAWGQCSIVTPHTVPKYFKHFRDRVQYKVGQFQWEDKDDALETVYKVMQPAVRYSLDDVTELPELVERYQDVPMGPKQTELYAAMKAQAMALTDSGEITAANAGAVLSKLLQISMGYVYTSDGRAVTLDGNARMDAVIDTVMASANKVIIFAPYKHVLEGISTRLTAEGVDFAVVSGDTPERQRAELFAKFQKTNRLRVLAAHPQCMAHGLTLTAADTIIWFGPVTSLETFEQANGRIRRIGQKHKQLVLKLQSTAAERKMYRLLEKRQRIQNNLLGLFSE